MISATGREGVVKARAEQFDLALQLHGDGTVTNGLIARLGARRTAGLALRGSFQPDAASFPEPPDGSEVERTLAPLRALGLDCADRRLE